jgi:hypothetical protein
MWKYESVKIWRCENVEMKVVGTQRRSVRPWGNLKIRKPEPTTDFPCVFVSLRALRETGINGSVYEKLNAE